MKTLLSVVAISAFGIACAHADPCGPNQAPPNVIPSIVQAVMTELRQTTAPENSGDIPLLFTKRMHDALRPYLPRKPASPGFPGVTAVQAADYPGFAQSPHVALQCFPELVKLQGDLRVAYNEIQKEAQEKVRREEQRVAAEQAKQAEEQRKDAERMAAEQAKQAQEQRQLAQEHAERMAAEQAKQAEEQRKAAQEHAKRMAAEQAKQAEDQRKAQEKVWREEERVAAEQAKQAQEQRQLAQEHAERMAAEQAKQAEEQQKVAQTQAEIRAKQAEENRRVANLPENRLFEAYWRYAHVLYCYKVREGYAMIYISDPELARAQTVAKAIEAKILAEQPGLDTDAIWRKALERNDDGPVSDSWCKRTYGELVEMSPVGVFNMQKP